MNEQEFFKYAYYLIIGPKDDAEFEEFSKLRNQYYKIKQGEIENDQQRIQPTETNLE